MPVLPQTMSAAVLAGPRRVEVVELPVPEPGAGEVLVELTAVGLCGSDVHYWRQGRIGDQVAVYPHKLGHEPAGVIVALGSGVRERQVGQAVALEPGQSCGSCRVCRMGRSNLCPAVRFLGSPGMPGALQRYLAWPAELTEPLPPGVSDRQGAAAEPLGVAVQACDLLGPRAAESGAVIGAGPVGLCVIALARALGARVVAVLEPRPYRRRVALGLGAETAVASRAEFLEAVKAATAGVGAELTWECSGAEEGLELCVEAAALGGRAAFIGIPETDQVGVNPHFWRRKELAIVNVRRSNRTLARSLRLLAGNGLGLEGAGFFHGPLGLAEVQGACARLEDLETPWAKVWVDPRR